MQDPKPNLSFQGFPFEPVRVSLSKGNLVRVTLDPRVGRRATVRHVRRRAHHRRRGMTKFALLHPQKVLEDDGSGGLRPREGTTCVAQLLREAGKQPKRRDGARAAVRLVGCGLVVDHQAEGTCEFSYAIAGRVLCVMQGHVENVTYLWHKLDEMVRRKGHGQARFASSAPAGDCVLHVREAELLASMFEEMGSDMLPKIRGKFAMVCYNSETGKLMAARDPSGELPLYHFRTKEHVQVFANTDEIMVPGLEIQQVEEIPAGCFMAGERGRLVRFASSETEQRENAQQAVEAAKKALWPKVRHEPTGMMVRDPSKEPKLSGACKGDGENGKHGALDTGLPPPLEPRPEDAVLPRDISPCEVARPRPKRMSLPRIESGIQLKVDQLDQVGTPPCLHCVSGETSSAPEPRRTRRRSSPLVDSSKDVLSRPRVLGFHIPEEHTCVDHE